MDIDGGDAELGIEPVETLDAIAGHGEFVEERGPESMGVVSLERIDEAVAIIVKEGPGD